MDFSKCTWLVLFVLVAVWGQYCYSTSIYVGSHASGSRAQLTHHTAPYEDCKDFDTRKCQKIVYWLGHDVCKDKTSEYAKSLNRICPKSCGLCGCKDVGIFCTMLSSLCNHANETGKFLQHNCPKTCKTCSKATGADGDHEFAALL